MARVGDIILLAPLLILYILLFFGMHIVGSFRLNDEGILGQVSVANLLNTDQKILQHLINLEACPRPANFPSSIQLTLENYKNWAQEIEVKQIWRATPRTSDDIVVLANWAFMNSYTLRPSGFSLNWSPLVVNGDEGHCSRIILVETPPFFNKMEMLDDFGAVRVEVGASLDTLTDFLETNGKELLGLPSTGSASIGGMIATGVHGAGIPMAGQLGNSGTLSHMVLSLVAVVWNAVTRNYEIRTFSARDPETSALVVNLGRIFLTEVTLEVSPLTTRRCLSRLDVPVETLFAAPRSKDVEEDLSINVFVEKFGAVGVVWFPFTENPWIRIFSAAPTKPVFSRKTNHPYNFPFQDNLPLVASDIANKIITGNAELAPSFGKLSLTGVEAGLFGTFSVDIWGNSRNILLNVKTTTLRVTDAGIVLLMSRNNLQFVFHQLTTFFKQQVQSYAKQNLFPVNCPFEVRVTGVDRGGPLIPSLSPIKPVENHPEMDTAIWIDVTTFPNSRQWPQFAQELETFLWTNFSASMVVVRPQWSKGFAYTNGSAWANRELITDWIPNSFGMEWQFALSVFDKYDPNEVFTNKFLKTLLG